MVALGAYIYSQNDRYLSAVQHHLGDAARHRARLHRAGADGRAADSAASTSRWVRWPASSSSSARSSCSTSRSPRHGRSGSRLMLVRAAAVDRRCQRLADPVREVHPGRRDAGHLHRAAGLQLPAARRARTASSAATVTERSSRQDRARCRVAFVVLVLCALRMEFAAAPARGWGHAAARRRVGRGVGAPGGRAASTAPSSSGYVVRLAVHLPRRARPAGPARHRRPRAGRRLHPDAASPRSSSAARACSAAAAPSSARCWGPGSSSRCSTRRCSSSLDPDLAVHLPGRADRHRRRRLQPGASQRVARPRSTVSDRNEK